MSNVELALWSFPVLLFLIFIRIPIGLSMLVCGLAGAWVVYGSYVPILNQLKQVTYSTFSSYSLSVIPLFLLMGQFAALGGLSQALFKAAEAWIGHRKGGVAMAAVGACAGFGAICGSSLATAATMGQVALPELKRAGYASGIRDAALARQVRPGATLYEQFSVGPQLHMLEGAVQVTPEHFDYDLESGQHLGIFRWDHS